MKKLLSIIITGILALAANAQSPVYKLSNDPTGLAGKNFVVTIEWPANTAYSNVSLDNAFIGILYDENTSLTKTNVKGSWVEDMTASKSLINSVCGSSVNPDDFNFTHFNLPSNYVFGDRKSGGSDTLFRIESSTYISTGKITMITNQNPSNTVEGCLYTNGVKNTGTIDPNFPSTSTGFDIEGTGGTLLLPVELINFTAKWDELNAKINWSTAMELNNSYFVLERNIDGAGYFPIEIIASKSINGNSNEVLNYEFIDPNVKTIVANEVYYRLKQYDFDGKYAYMTPVVLNKHSINHNSLVVYPNPSSGHVYVSLQQKSSVNTTVQLQDLSGRIVQEHQIIKNEESPLKIDLSNIDRGFYNIVVYNNQFASTKKIVVK